MTTALEVRRASLAEATLAELAQQAEGNLRLAQQELRGFNTDDGRVRPGNAYAHVTLAREAVEALRERVGDAGD